MKTQLFKCLCLLFTANLFFSSADASTMRPVRFQPQGEDFVLLNGNRKYIRALYGTNTAFRVESGDVPEFGMYMPRMGGHFRFGLVKGNESKWLSDADTIEYRYRAGSSIYRIKDQQMLGDGELNLVLLALGDAEGMIIKMEYRGAKPSAKLMWVYGGASNKRFSREGDLGVDDPTAFDLKEENCKNNLFVLSGNRFDLFYGTELDVLKKAAKGSIPARKITSGKEDELLYENNLSKEKIAELVGEHAKNVLRISGVFPTGALLKTADVRQQHSPMGLLKSKSVDGYAVLTGEMPILTSAPMYFELGAWQEGNGTTYDQLSAHFQIAEQARQKVAGQVKMVTPDPYFNTLGGALSIAADGVWEYPTYLHGAIGWRMRLNGWRCCYIADFLGWNDRARAQYDAYSASQITNIPPTIPHPAQNPDENMARALKKWGTQMYSDGYITRNPNETKLMHHYDMNMVFVDGFLWHLNWTGDKDYAKKMFPFLKRHLAWEKRNFDPNNDGLYDAYCCIWASDALQYSGGGVTHSSAYNYRANKMAAMVASKIGEDPTPYEKEAELILSAINKRLWLQNEGWWAEYEGLMDGGQLHKSAAVWSIYHSIDSDIHDPFQAYQAARYVDKSIPHIPVLSPGMEKDGYAQISTTNWQPYYWSINNVAHAETNHTALALWQAGEYDKAFKLFKSSILDAAYLGACPGNFGQVSFYDAARGECYRDFSDPIGVASRAFVQGLYGIIPDMMNGRLVIRPGFPSDWDSASIETPTIGYSFKREGKKETYVIKTNFGSPVVLQLELPVRYQKIARVTITNKGANWKINKDWVGGPQLVINGTKAEEFLVVVSYEGDAVKNDSKEYKAVQGEFLSVVMPGKISELYDPQNVLTDRKVSGDTFSGKVIGLMGERTIFAQVNVGELTWWQPIDLSVVRPIEVVSLENESPELRFAVRNNQTKSLLADLFVNGQLVNRLTLDGGKTSNSYVLVAPQAMMGTNKVELRTDRKVIFTDNVINWEIPATIKTQEQIKLDSFFNDKLSQIYVKGKYMAPRPPFTTLQIPTQGIGEWCIPQMMAEIDDKGFRASAHGNVFETPMGINFATPQQADKNNISFTSMWDNFPNKTIIPLNGKAKHIYLLMAGATNPMQSRFVNGTVKVHYTDGTSELLELINPETWPTVEQDFFTDGYAFYMKTPRPYRVALQNGMVARSLDKIMRLRNSAASRTIPGGAAVILDLPLNKDKELKSLEIAATAYEAIIGVMSATLIRE